MLGVAALLTVVAVLENTVAPWAPFYFGYAALATAVPLWWGGARSRWTTKPRLRPLALALGLAVLLQLVVRLITAAGDLPAMFGAMFEVAGARLGRPPAQVGSLYISFILIWAGLGEEVFYRGYVQEGLRRWYGALTAILAAPTIYAVLALGWLYERTDSLYPVIVCHYAFNLLA